ncbi:hypothetical protein CC2G_010980 [Coprinopsis cinerea AmutBmut pab1-1]|nr:hypothetical protein CC2G_010980 [Coprinopsis cinerea AmutBmut pab1-1]
MPTTPTTSFETVTPARKHVLRTWSTTTLMTLCDRPPSLFDTLPIELHAEIFAYCLPAFPQIGNGESPMHIAQVCRAWRALAHSTPRLWSSFEIEVEDSSSDDLAVADSPHSLRALSTVKVWLERSKNQPLSVRLIHIPTGRIPNQLSAQILAMFVLQARRWRHIEIIVPSTSLAAVQHILPDDFPILKSLTLHMKGVWNSPTFDIQALKVPWSQLTELDLRLDHKHLLDLDELADLLCNATSMTACRVNANCRLMPLESTQRERLVLPSLKSLHLILQGDGNDLASAQQLPTSHLPPESSLTSFLGLFAACSLTHLGLNWLVDGERTEQWSSVQAAFMASVKDLSPSLRSLEITYLPLGEGGLIQTLTQLPQLESLDLRFSLADQVHDPISDRTLQAMTLPGSGPQSQGVGSGSKSSTISPRASTAPEPVTLLPNLRRLHLQCTGARCTQAVLLNFIKSRGSAPTSSKSKHQALGRFHFYSMQQVIDRANQRTGEWLKSGMDLDIDSVVLL